MKIEEAKKEYRKFLAVHGLYDTSELAAVYFNARAHLLVEEDWNTIEKNDEYTMWQALCREYYDDALRSVKSLIAEGE